MAPPPLLPARLCPQPPSSVLAPMLNKLLILGVSVAVMTAGVLFLHGCQAPPIAHTTPSDSAYADLRAQLEACRKAHLSEASHEEVDRLRTRMHEHDAVIEDLRNRDVSLRRILDVYSKAVCLLHGTFGFVDPTTDADQLVIDDMGTPVSLSYIGSGFLVSADGDIVTNRHVAEPWWNNPTVAPLLGKGWVPRLLELTAYFPGRTPIRIQLSSIRTSQIADVAVLNAAVEGIPTLPLSQRPLHEYRGRRIVLMGYPTGLSALLARAEPNVVREILETANEPTAILQGLATHGEISPIITQGALNETTPTKLVYDAETTSGGSGGPVLALDGTVIGVNFAVTREFHGSNFGVPINYVGSLLDRTQD